MTDVLQFGDRTARSFDCGRCEAMLADAVDGLLSQEEQQFFDEHIAECGPCTQLLAEAQRGAALLEMLRNPAPEPSAALLEKILAQTSGIALPVPMAEPAPAMAPGYTNVLQFPNRKGGRGSGFGRILFEPRLAMTAAMAFFSIALTLDLMGVNPLNLRASDLSPSSLDRAFAQTRAHVEQYYSSLRVVYELESRVHDFQNVQENARDAAPAQNQNAPAVQAPDQQVQPAGEDLSAPDENQNQDQNQNNAAPQAAPSQQKPGGKSSLEPRGEPNSHVSRREAERAGGPKQTLTTFRRNTNSSRPAVSDAALDDEMLNDELKEYLGGISSAAYTGPLQKHAARRAA